jgi:ABC-type polysaccharide/polyol phosphate transport system ATPase subunit
MTVDVCCDRVSKRYRVPAARRPGLLARALGAPRRDFWALRDVSFDVARGEALGIIGPNGAGKSTILKLLSGITAPTEGEITIRGRLAALIEIGSGFHPELTGRENVYLSGSILGLRRREIDQRLASIAEFSGVGAFMDSPVKFYSSGMYVRLGFAIAAHLEPDVLLVDEVLAVGDAEFQARCLRRIENLKRRGVTMIFVSHDLGVVEQICDRAVLLERGTIAASGSAHEVVTAYQRLSAGLEPVPRAADAGESDAPMRIASMTLLTARGQETLTATAGDPLTVKVVLSASAAFDDVDVAVSFYDLEQGTLLAECTSRRRGEALTVAPGETTIDFDIPHLLFAPGIYTVGATATPAHCARPLAWRFGRTTLYVEGNESRRGSFLLPYQCHTSTTPSAVLS